MNPEIIGILLAAVGGAAVGVERERSGRASGPKSHFAGIRTFTLLGGLAGIAGWLWTTGVQSLALVIVIGAVSLIVAAYASVAKRDPDGTTEVAALIVVTAGVLAGLGRWGLSSGIVAITALLLIEKSRLHSLVRRIPDVGLKAGFRFGVMAVVILPLLPEGPYGPLGGIRPRELWILVLFFSGINYAAYVIRSCLGPEQGYVWAGLLGGMISSTSVTLSFSRLSRNTGQPGTALALGVIAACTMLYVRVTVAASVLNPGLGRSILPYAIGPTLVGAGFLWYGLKRARLHEEALPADQTTNPLQVRSAIQMAILFQVVLFVMTAVKNQWGQSGLLLSGAILGLTDVDALVISMAKITGSPDQLRTAAIATVVGILSNTFLKLGLAIGIGHGSYRKLTVIGLVLLGAITGLSLALL